MKILENQIGRATFNFNNIPFPLKWGGGNVNKQREGALGGGKGRRYNHGKRSAVGYK